MGYYHEIVEYLGTRDARFTVYGTVLGIFVLYLIRVVYRAFVIWKKLLIEGGQRSFNHFLIWMLYHYRQCPRWLRFLSVRAARVWHCSISICLRQPEAPEANNVMWRARRSP